MAWRAPARPVRLYRSFLEEAFSSIQQGARALEGAEPNPSASNQAARLLLEKGLPAQALEVARAAQHEGSGHFQEWEGLFWEGLALAKLGRTEAAEATAEKLRQSTESLPTEKEKRRHLHLVGQLDLARGDVTSAIEKLEMAQSMLPVRGIASEDPRPPPVAIWFSLARAYLDAGDEAMAEQWFQRITESTTEHVWWPIPYVRSFYFLAKIQQRRGETAQARESFQRFVDFWKDGELDRARIEEALGKLS